MAVHMQTAVYIDSINRTSKTVLPIKFGNFLDERLDECNLSLRGIKVETFSPLTPVEIRIKSTEYFGDWNDNPTLSGEANEEVYHYIVANDSATEVRPGSGLFSHELYLLEVTKVAECIVVDALTYTNDIGRNYTENAEFASPIGETYTWVDKEPPLVETYYKAAYKIGTTLTVLGAELMAGNPNTRQTILQSQTIVLRQPDGQETEILKGNNFWDSATVELNQDGIYTLTYILKKLNNQEVTYYYNFTGIENKLPLKPWSITDVINRLLDLCEPIRQGEKPRFRLNGMSADGSIIPEGQEGSGQAAKFDKILAPQFALTRQTLRECLQEIGKVIHGEPRLKIKKDNGGYYYEVIYDLYASQEGTDVYTMPYASKGLEWVINNYQTWIDTNAENLVNQLDKLSGVIVEPGRGGAKSVRTENQYVRITDNNMLIATQYPIYTVDKLEYVYTENGATKTADITPYLFEKSVYDTQLSSYEAQYPYSKAYALYFEQGKPNIGGLNFKVESSSSVVFKNYAITNILKQVLGSNYKLPDYPLLAFRVTYTPYYSARVAQSKTNYKDFKYAAALIYNQQSNVIESRYYGENLKGVAARLGNIEKSLMYCFKAPYKVPKAGQLYQKDYYISAVATEVLPTYVRCTVGLSKDFNRISAYIGVPSEKRYYEISQKQAVDRNVLLREYVVIGDEETPDSKTNLYLGQVAMEAIAHTFNHPTNLDDTAVITNVSAQGKSYSGKPLPAVNLPVVSSAFGNSVSFSWKYENNYSAGAISQERPNTAVNDKEEEITGYWQTDARYTDYYGRAYYMDFSLLFGTTYTQENSLNLPAADTLSYSYAVSSLNSKSAIIRKDNREALQINYQIDFVTNTDIIIGSALASYNPLVRGGRKQYGVARLYVFPTELNKFTNHVESWEDVDLSLLPSVEVAAETEYVSGAGMYRVKVQVGSNIAENVFPASGKSWAIVIPQSKAAAELVEDEQGNQIEYQKIMGGDLLIGRNQEVTAGQEFTPIYFTPKREIYDKSVWKDNL